MFMLFFLLFYIYVVAMITKAIVVFMWPFLVAYTYILTMEYKTYPVICGALSGVKLNVSEAYITSWLNFGGGRYLEKDSSLYRAACEVDFTHLSLDLFWPGMQHAYTLKTRPGYMNISLAPSPVRGKDAALWVDTVIKLSHVGDNQRDKFDMSLGLYYELHAETIGRAESRTLYWTAVESPEHVVIGCRMSASGKPYSCQQQWLNDSIGSIVSVSYESVLKKEWRQIKNDIDRFIDGLKK